MVEDSLLRWILVFPLLGVLFHTFLGYRMGRRTVSVVGLGVVGIAFLITLLELSWLLAAEPGTAFVDSMFPWIVAGNLDVQATLRFDALSSVMAMIITGVGFLIHVYSAGYMSHDEDYARYFLYLNLFMLSMLLLVLADNIVFFFVGWEGVGVCSYLLIGFWHRDDANASAGKKAFIVNRIGDAGFLVGLMLLFWTLGAEGVWTLEFSGFRENAALIPAGVATIVALCLFVGAAGKSAQIPLYVWLPDAMAGPTPVSALIHAATMVTAGVYMIGRMNFLYAMSPAAMSVVAVVGAATAFFAATIGLVQNDIKKVLAYSTVSQLGYMFLAMGVGAWSAGIFHLMTHAFFKGLLFLGAGSVIHGMSGEQDIQKMGGLWKRMPITFATFAVGCAAIAGVPMLAGFFSKDMILFNAFAGEYGNPVLWGVAVAGASLTAFYMFRLLFLTFFGELRADDETAAHIRESPWSMTLPLIVLAGLSIVGGYVGLPAFVAWGDAFGHYLDPVFHAGHHGHHSLALELALMAVSIAAAGAGIVTAWLFYFGRPGLPAELAARYRATHEWLLNKYWVDEAYDATAVAFTRNAADGLWKADDSIIDGTVNGVARFIWLQSEVWRRLQTGNVQHYALTFLFGVVAVLGYFLA